MERDREYLDQARIIAKEATHGAVKVDSKGRSVAYSNKNDTYAYIKALEEGWASNEGATMYLTHGVNSRNAMKLVDAGIKRVVYSQEFGIGVGTELLRSQGIEVVKLML